MNNRFERIYQLFIGLLVGFVLLFGVYVFMVTSTGKVLSTWIVKPRVSSFTSDISPCRRTTLKVFTSHKIKHIDSKEFKLPKGKTYLKVESDLDKPQIEIHGETVKNFDFSIVKRITKTYLRLPNNSHDPFIKYLKKSPNYESDKWLSWKSTIKGQDFLGQFNSNDHNNTNNGDEWWLLYYLWRR
ncbi:hypothetical protein [uncultured Limosilactobacillus sp.]|uniref:hypothetical protein n=1 Tax=uncultured Limosilactobacillus sp. TaxID=2837629 RepID=UPI0025F241E3|nr:hypothetical protein [uncultured Limosilactobacillus sp.]